MGGGIGLGYWFLKWTLNSCRKRIPHFPGIHWTWFSGTGVLGAQRREKCDCLRASVASSGSTTLSRTHCFHQSFQCRSLQHEGIKNLLTLFPHVQQNWKGQRNVVNCGFTHIHQSINTLSRNRSELHRNKNNKPIYQQQKNIIYFAVAKTSCDLGRAFDLPCVSLALVTLHLTYCSLQ